MSATDTAEALTWPTQERVERVWEKFEAGADALEELMRELRRRIDVDGDPIIREGVERPTHAEIGLLLKFLTVFECVHGDTRRDLADYRRLLEEAASEAVAS
jgi:hypothetical protein